MSAIIVHRSTNVVRCGADYPAGACASWGHHVEVLGPQGLLLALCPKHARRLARDIQLLLREMARDGMQVPTDDAHTR